MRFVATLAIALLLAASAVLLGYAGWLTLRRVVLPYAPALAHEPLRAGPQPPARLPPSTNGETPLQGTALVPTADLRIAIAIALRNLPAGLDPQTAGVALFGSQDGADFRFYRLAELGNELVLRTDTLATDALRIVLAEDREQARHSYLCRVDHAFSRQPAGTAPLELDASAQRVRFLVPDGDTAYGPLQLRRLGEPDWHAPRAVAAGLRSQRQAPGELWLGAGRYELSDPLRPERRQQFAVPGDGTVVLDPVFNPVVVLPRNDRP
jgi:hypothetical protein